MKAAFLFILTFSLFSCLESTNSSQGSIEFESNNPSESSCAYSITEPGEYTLNQDLESETCAIEITASNVKLDLNGHTLKGPHNMETVSYGIKSIKQSNVEVFNGKIEGFLFGVTVIGASGRGDDVSDNYVHDLEVTHSSQKGIRAGGYNVKVINNVVRHTGKTTVSPSAYGFGIEVKGPSCLVSNNIVTDTYGGALPANGIIPEGVAISFSHYSTYCVAENNYIENSVTVSDKSTFGFWVDVYSLVTLKNNYIRNMHYSGVVPNFTILEHNDLDKDMIHVIMDR